MLDIALNIADAVCDGEAVAKMLETWDAKEEPTKALLLWSAALEMILETAGTDVWDGEAVANMLEIWDAKDEPIEALLLWGTVLEMILDIAGTEV